MLRSERSRSRSPVLQPTEETARIADAIAGFASNVKSRPTGLQEDGKGAFRLEDLTRRWGEAQGLQNRQILYALRVHMFHDNDAGQLRFAIDADRDGHIVIRLMPKRTADMLDSPMAGAVYEAAAVPAADLANSLADRSVLPNVPLGEHRIVSRHGSISQEAVANGARMHPLENRLDISLDDCIIAEKTVARPALDRDHLLRHQHGLERDRNHRRRSPRGARRDRSRDGRRYGAGEKVQRWLGWFFARGHEELAVTLEAGGWAKFDAVVAAMHKSRRDLCEFNAPTLRTLLETTDEMGRFELHADRLRKLRKDTKTSAPRRPEQPLTAAKLEINKSSLPDEIIELDLEPDSMQKEAQVPSKPPGDNWTRYQDDGSFWWYYDGPLGIWWWSEELPEPKEYKEDDD